MKIVSTYSVKIKDYNRILNDTITIYRNMVKYLIDVCLENWDDIKDLHSQNIKQSYVEKLIHKTKNRPTVKYHFDRKFYKVPSYLRRSAISEAIGKVASYKSNLKSNPKAGRPRAGRVFPTLYNGNMFVHSGTYSAKIKVYIRNTWDWLTVELNKGDIDYIHHHCQNSKVGSPTLIKRGKEWSLDFSFEEKVELNDTDILEQTIVSVDLGINNACVCSVMKSDGTILGRHFLNLSIEKDHLSHSVERIRNAQQNGSRKMPKLWAKTNGINKDIAVKTKTFIIEIAQKYSADVIVMEHLDTQGRKRGSKKQNLHLWKKKAVLQMVTHRAHRLGIHISTVNARNTSKLAYDGSGIVTRGINGNYSICHFTTGKEYNCDLSATYNIGARYFIRMIMNSLPKRDKMLLEAKVPSLSKRSTCTLSDLISLNAALMGIAS